MYSKKIYTFEMYGALFIITLGTLMHFTYAWSGYKILFAYLSSVNESIWEHFKMSIYPQILWMLIQLIFGFKKSNNFLFAKFISMLIVPVVILMIFFGYYLILKELYLGIDIASYFIGVFIAQFAAYKIQILPPVKSLYNRLAAGAIALLFIIFLVLTAVPPHKFIFRDFNYNNYGIIPEKISGEAHKHEH